MYQATQTGMPIMRPLIFAYASDSNLSDRWDEYLYGNEILVAPVTRPEATTRSVYLPAGRWMNYNDKATLYEGPATVSAMAPLGTIPLFVREGAIIPRGDILKANNDWDRHWVPKLRIEVFPSNTFSTHFDYFTGGIVRKIILAPRSDGIEIKLDDLGMPGTFEVYCRNIQGVTRNGVTLREGVDFSYDAQRHKLTASFTGKATLTIRGASGLFGSSRPRLP